MTILDGVRWLTPAEWREDHGYPPLALTAADAPNVGGIVIDALGRRWDPRKHPRGRDGRFIEVGGLVKFFESIAGRKVAGSGTVERIDGDSIHVRVGNVSPNVRGAAAYHVGQVSVFNKRQIATVPDTEVRLDRAGNVHPHDRELPDMHGKLVRVGDTVKVAGKTGKVTRVDDNSGRVVVRAPGRGNEPELHIMRRVETVERLDEPNPRAERSHERARLDQGRAGNPLSGEPRRLEPHAPAAPAAPAPRKATPPARPGGPGGPRPPRGRTDVHGNAVPDGWVGVAGPGGRLRNDRFEKIGSWYRVHVMGSRDNPKYRIIGGRHGQPEHVGDGDATSWNEVEQRIAAAAPGGGAADAVRVADEAGNPVPDGWTRREAWGSTWYEGSGDNEGYLIRPVQHGDMLAGRWWGYNVYKASVNDPNQPIHPVNRPGALSRNWDEAQAVLDEHKVLDAQNVSLREVASGRIPGSARGAIDRAINSTNDRERGQALEEASRILRANGHDDLADRVDRVRLGENSSANAPGNVDGHGNAVPDGWTRDETARAETYHKDGYYVRVGRNNLGQSVYKVNAPNDGPWGEARDWNGVEQAIQSHKDWHDEQRRLNEEQRMPTRDTIQNVLERRGYSQATRDAVRYGTSEDAIQAIQADPAHEQLQGDRAKVMWRDQMRPEQRAAVDDWEKLDDAIRFGLRGDPETRPEPSVRNATPRARLPISHGDTPEEDRLGDPVPEDYHLVTNENDDGRQVFRNGDGYEVHVGHDYEVYSPDGEYIDDADSFARADDIVQEHVLEGAPEPGGTPPTPPEPTPSPDANVPDGWHFEREVVISSLDPNAQPGDLETVKQYRHDDGTIAFERPNGELVLQRQGGGRVSRADNWNDVAPILEEQRHLRESGNPFQPPPEWGEARHRIVDNPGMRRARSVTEWHTPDGYIVSDSRDRVDDANRAISVIAPDGTPLGGANDYHHAQRLIDEHRNRPPDAPRDHFERNNGYAASIATNLRAGVHHVRLGNREHAQRRLLEAADSLDQLQRSDNREDRMHHAAHALTMLRGLGGVNGEETALQHLLDRERNNAPVIRDAITPREANVPEGALPIVRNLPPGRRVEVPDDEHFNAATADDIIGLLPQARGRHRQLPSNDRYMNNLRYAMQDQLEGRNTAREVGGPLDRRIADYFERAMAGRRDDDPVLENLMNARARWNAMRAGNGEPDGAPHSFLPNDVAGWEQRLRAATNGPEVDALEQEIENDSRLSESDKYHLAGVINEIRDNGPANAVPGERDNAGFDLVGNAADQVSDILYPIRGDIRDAGLEPGLAAGVLGADEELRRISRDLRDGTIDRQRAQEQLGAVMDSFDEAQNELADAGVPGDIINDVNHARDQIALAAARLDRADNNGAPNLPTPDVPYLAPNHTPETGPDEPPLATWERELLDGARSPNGLPPPVRPPAPRRPRVRPGYRGRGQFADATMTNIHGDELRNGLIVRTPEGTEGYIARMHPPSRRVVVKNDDGYEVMRDIDTVRVQYEGGTPEPNAPNPAPEPPAPAPNAPAQAPAPPSPSDIIGGIDAGARAQAIENMHAAGAQQFFPAEPGVVRARNHLKEAIRLAGENDREGFLRNMNAAILDYSDAMRAGIGHDRLREDVIIRRAAAAELVDDVVAGRAIVGDPNHDSVLGLNVEQLRDIRLQIPRRPAGGDIAGRELWRAGFAIDDALDGNRSPDERRNGLDRAEQRLERADRGGMHRAANLLRQLRAIRNKEGEPGPAALPPLQAEPGEAWRTPDPNLPAHPNAVNPNATGADYADAWGIERGETIAEAARTRPSLEHLQNLDRPALLDAVGEVVNGEYGNTGLELKVTSASRSGDHIYVNGAILDKDGNRVGQFEREIGPNRVYNALLDIREGVRGGGVATAFNARMEDWYIANGIQKVDVTAAGSGHYIGGFVWARNGFDWRSGTGKSEVLSISRGIRRYLDPNDPESKALLDDIERRARDLPEEDPNFPTPFELSNIGWKPGMGRHDMWAGKQAMMNTTWSGTKTLDPNARAYKQQVALKRLPDPAKKTHAVEQYGPEHIPDELRAISSADLRHEAPNPGDTGIIGRFAITAAGGVSANPNEEASGVNTTWFVRDTETGRRFIIKKDTYFWDEGVESEVAVSAMLRGTNYYGASYVEQHPTERSLLIATFVGEQHGTTNNRMLNRDFRRVNELLDGMADPRELLHARIVNTVTANIDRHGGNAMWGQDANGGWHLLLYDHGHAINPMAEHYTNDDVISLQHQHALPAYRGTLWAYLDREDQAASVAAIQEIAQQLMATVQSHQWRDPSKKAQVERRLQEIINDPGGFLRRIRQDS